jgi:integrase/recombinase XerD
MSKETQSDYVSHEVQRFAEYLRAEKRTAATIRSYTRSLGRFYEFAGKTLRQLTKADMQAWKGELAGHYCENSMVPLIAAVNTYMVKVADRPDLKMQAPRWVEKDVMPLSEDEVMAFLKEAHRPMLGEKGHKSFETCHRDYMMACLMYYVGLRASEVLNLRITGLDMERRMLRVHEGKEKNYEIVLLNDITVQAIRDHLTLSRALVKPQTGFEDRLVLSENGRPVSRTALWKMVKRVAIRTGIPKNVYPHLFRHTMATKMAEEGLNAFEIQAQTRHKHIETLQKYVHISEKARRSAYDRAFGGPQQPQSVLTGPKPPLGPDLFPQGNQQAIMMTPQQLQQIIQAAIGTASRTPPKGYQ